LHTERPHAKQLVDEIRRAFPVTPGNHPRLIAYATGDAATVEFINGVLAGRAWTEVTFDEWMSCGPDEVKDYLSEEALQYFLPGLLTVTVSTAPETRLHEVVSMLTMPASSAYADVWEAFGDGLFSGWDSSSLLPSAIRLLQKLEGLRRSFSSVQRACVATYIEIVHGDVADPSSRALVEKWARYWKEAVPTL
jgi:hypothetical protein